VSIDEHDETIMRSFYVLYEKDAQNIGLIA
jgi:hypothetical protein